MVLQDFHAELCVILGPRVCECSVPGILLKTAYIVKERYCLGKPYFPTAQTDAFCQGNDLSADIPGVFRLYGNVFLIDRFRKPEGFDILD
jgi:hypothetical protein